MSTEMGSSEFSTATVDNSTPPSSKAPSHRLKMGRCIVAIISSSARVMNCLRPVAGQLLVAETLLGQLRCQPCLSSVSFSILLSKTSDSATPMLAFCQAAKDILESGANAHAGHKLSGAPRPCNDASQICTCNHLEDDLYFFRIGGRSSVTVRW
jgi:hypothetical protein